VDELARLIETLRLSGLRLRHARFADGSEVTCDPLVEDSSARPVAPADADGELDALERFVNRRKVTRD
jgi:hypothetical protein